MKQFHRIYQEDIKEKHPNFCARCNQRTNHIVIEARKNNNITIQYLKCPKCGSTVSHRISRILKEFKINPLMVVKSNA